MMVQGTHTYIFNKVDRTHNLRDVINANTFFEHTKYVKIACKDVTKNEFVLFISTDKRRCVLEKEKFSKDNELMALN